MSKYFRYFPTVDYNGNTVVNITKRVRPTKKLTKDPYIFLPYTVEGDDRAEDIAYYYYGDVSKVWLVYLANNIIDPYTQWVLKSDDFEKTIRAKYSHSVTTNKVYSWDAFEVSKHGFKTTDPVIYTSSNPLSGLTSGNLYYVIRLTQNRFRLASTPANALAGTYISIGTNTSDHTFALDLETFLFNQTITSNILYAEHADGTKITYDTYRLDDSLVLGDWTLMRVYEYETIKNENLRTIWLINKDYADQVESDLYGVLNGRI